VSILDRILARVGERLAGAMSDVPLADVQAAAEAAPARPSFREALARPGTTLIAEAKHASPSRGTLRDPYDPVELARTYEAAGARAMSVLTEPDFFGGSPEHLRAVRDACALPLLRKDFVTDAYQVWEARAWGASAVLLIVAALEDARLRELLLVAAVAGVDALVEVHTEAEAARAAEAGAPIVGINNRDLVTFETDRTTTGKLARLLPAGTVIVSESGISTRAHVREVESAGAHAVLVGEALVVEANPAGKIRELLGEGPQGGAS
jgi:indole-3-glycerol phosphate synthase